MASPFLVTMILRISVEEERREGKEEFKNFDMAEYSKATFGMYQGKKTNVRIEFVNDMCGVFIDRFGKDISIRKVDAEHSEIHVMVNVSPQFFGWIFSLGKGVKVTGPEEVVEEMKKQAKEFLENLG